jgi:hypothetical protein
MSRLTRDRFNGIANLVAVAVLAILVLIPIAIEVGTYL